MPRIHDRYLLKHATLIELITFPLRGRQAEAEQEGSSCSGLIQVMWGFCPECYHNVRTPSRDAGEFKRLCQLLLLTSSFTLN